MDWFDDDFEEIIREFFGHSPGSKKKYTRTFISGEHEERVIDFIEDKDKVYLVFELPGYNEEDILINIVGNTIEIKANKKNTANIKPYLVNKLAQGVYFKKTLPKFIKTKNFKHSFKNGVLEIVFNKK